MKIKKAQKMIIAMILAFTMFVPSHLSVFAYLASYDDSDVRKTSADVALQAAEEGIVLLKNDENLLPLVSGQKVNVFGAASYDPFLDGGGSGAIRKSSLLVDFYAALDKSGIQYNSVLRDWYKTWYEIHKSEPAFRAAAAEADTGNVFGTAAPAKAEAPFLHLTNPDYVWRQIKRVSGTNPEYNADGSPVYLDTYISGKPEAGSPLLDNQWDKALKYTNETAIIWLGRSGSESSDLELQDIKLRPSERDLIKHARKDYKNVIVIFNTLATMEMGWLENVNSLLGVGETITGAPGGANSTKTEVDAAMMIWGPGEVGMNAVAGVLKGTVNPSGHLADTIIYDIQDNPAMRNYGDMGYSQQTGGIARKPTWAYALSNGQFTGQGLRETQTNKMTSLAPGLTGEGNFNSSDMTFLHYEEGIYMGYRYFETFGKTDLVQYPFGYGLSYTKYDWNVESVKQDSDSVTVDVKVTNNGSAAGKDVVEVYFSAPYTSQNIADGVEKAKNVLGGFAKTKKLAPGESEVVSIEIDKYTMASYNMTKERYILDAGSYEINVMKSLNGKNIQGNLVESRTINIDKKDFFADPVTGTTYQNLFDFAAIGSTGGGMTVLSRNDHDGTYPKTREERWNAFDGGIYQLPNDFAASANPFPTPVAVTDENRDQIFQFAANTSNNSIKLVDVYDAALAEYAAGKYDTIADAVWNNSLWDAFIGQMTADEALAFISDCGYRTIPLARLGVPATIDNDGPQQIKATSNANNGGSAATDPAGMAYPINTMISCTWNVELSRQVGECVGNDAAKVNVQVWYAPSINLHRTPLSGRNFEYFSEDGFLTGKMAAQMTAGAQSKGLVVTLKHYALNDCEMAREGISTYADEQTIRELYLHAFEIAVKEGGARGIMTAFNRVGRIYAGASEALCTDILRGEWGFKGFLITDWYGGRRNGWRNPILCVYAQNDGLLRGSGSASSDVTYMKRALIESNDMYSNPIVFSQAVKRSVKNICAFKMFTLAFEHSAIYADVVVEASAWKEVLLDTINEAETLVGSDEYNKTYDFVRENLDKALIEANAVYNNYSASKDDVISAWYNLVDAIHYLAARPADKAKLSILAELAEGLDLSKYNVGVQAFTDALTNANTVLADVIAQQNEVDTAYNALVKAIAGMRYEVNKGMLQALYDTVSGKDLTPYTDESAQVFLRALAFALDTLNNPGATQDDADLAFDKLAEADSKLTLIPLAAESTASNSTDPSSTDGSSAADSASSTAGSSTPKTGDYSAIVMAVSLIGLAGVAVIINKKKRSSF